MKRSALTNDALKLKCLIVALAVATVVRGESWKRGRYKGERFPVPLEKQKKIFEDANKTPNNIEYVGCGYDMYNGSNIDEHAGFSLNNYRAPILDTYNITQTTLKKQPNQLGIWVFNEFLCDISSELTSIKSLQTLNKIVGSHDVKEYAVLGSYLMTKTTNTLDMLNKLLGFRKVIVKKYNCAVYSAGIVTENSRWTMTRFHNIVKKLMNGCKGGWKEGDCPLDKYTTSMDDGGCEICVGPWMRFFADFGTHITARVTMGGIIRKFSNYSQLAAKRKESTVEVKAATSSTWFGIFNKTAENTSHGFKEDSRSDLEDDALQYTVGPEPNDESLPPEAIEDWVCKVAQNPVPIKTEFMSLSEFMPDDESRKMYAKALKYYAKLKGVDYRDDNLTAQKSENSLLHLMKQSSVVVLNGPQEMDKDVCMGKSRILFGFAVNLNERMQILKVKPCYSGLNACIIDHNKDVNSSFILAYCAEVRDYDFTQKIIKGSSHAGIYSEAKCPRNTVVGLGAIIRFQDPVMIKSCPKGNSGCGFPDLGINGLIWIVCVPQNTFGLNTYDIRANLVMPRRGITCDSGQRVINGFSIMSGGAGNNVRAEACGKFETTCRSSFKDPTYVASYVICAH
ncbi:hypothetical protein X943_003540 [Babesia divergens]|uniref:MACPF domain-containing protein n=1 Tax=Babesia divergens TaxID=32595 RepID=A0AAD9GEN9_BABDI|nr:hypothetical protein X943_003540 [Babesia divergens]